MLLPIEHTVNQSLQTHFADQPDAHFILGVSGGIDSTSLLHIFSRLNVSTTVVHVNYQTRGKASDKDAAFVQRTCKQLDIDCNVYTADSEKADFSNFQNWARSVRYTQYEIAKRRTNATAIALAHNQNDQLETILQKIFRGAGMASWTGMEVWNGTLFRPLLNVSRDEIKQYCHDRDITYRTDESNFKSKYARNFLRNDWLPQLKEHFPGWQKNVLRIANQSRIFESSLSYILDDVTTNNGAHLGRASFLSLPRTLQKSVLLFFIKKKYPDVSLSTHALSGITSLADLQTGQKIQFTHTLSLLRDRQTFKLVTNPTAPPAPAVLNRDALPVMYKGVQLQLCDFTNPDFNQHLYLDADTLTWPLTIRPWKAGDKIQPLGMKGHQSIADHLTNRKVSSEKKQTAFVIENFDDSIAAVIFPPFTQNDWPGTISEQYKCKTSTQTTLMIKPVS